MPPKKKNRSVIAVCIQEPQEDGSQMEMGPIKGDDLAFLHQGFITDTIRHALAVREADTRVYSVGVSGRRKFMKIVLDYVEKTYTGGQADLQRKLSHHELEKERWGIRIEKVFDDCFASGYKDVLVIGSRTPTVSTAMMTRALGMLKKSDAVFGPTPEGRYYVIGMHGEARIRLSMFDWTSPSIYYEVANAFTEAELAWSELEIWYAVESSDELEIMVRDINQFRFEDDEFTARETEHVMERLLSKLGA